jgi:hypothetical protein
VAPAHLVVVEVVRRGDLHAARAERGIDVLVGDDGDAAARERQNHLSSDEFFVALIRWVDGDCHVAQQGLGPRGGHGEALQAADRPALEGIEKLPDLSLLFLGVDLEVRHRGAEHRVPVDQALAAVDEAFLVEAHEHLGDRARHARVHGEVAGVLALGVGVIPVRGGAEAPHLPRDGRARLLFPLPDPLDELLAAEVVAALALLLELALDHDLRGDAGVVRAHDPVGVVAAHAVESDQRVHQRLLERVAHVQRAGDVRRGQLDAIGRRPVILMPEQPLRLPAGVPALLDGSGIEALVQHYLELSG